MIFKKTAKKICAAVTAGIIGLTLTLPVMPAQVAMAKSKKSGVETGVGIAIGAAQMAAQRAEYRKQLKAYNETDEGRQAVFEEAKKKYGVNEDYTLNARVDTLMSNLSKAVAQVDPSINDKPYLYFVNSSNEINAFCTFSHVMSINTGILKAFPNDDEIAVVVGHEMGHGQKDHVYKGALSNIDKYIIASVGVAAAGGSLLSNIVGNLALNQSIAHGTKANEKEADQLAFDYITHSNYNPGATAAVWQRFLDLYGDNSQNALGSIFAPSDHPNNAARRDTYVKRLEEYSDKHVTAKDGTVLVNNKTLLTAAPANGMSSAERSYFIFGNLAAAYHNGHNKESAYVSSGTVYLGAQPIITPVSGDESAQAIADRLNEIK